MREEIDGAVVPGALKAKVIGTHSGGQVKVRKVVADVPVGLGVSSRHGQNILRA